MPIYKPFKMYSENLNDLIVDQELSKGKPLPIGTVRNWSGTSYVKEADGWKPVAHKKHEKEVVEVSHTKPQASSESKPESNTVNDHEKAALKEYQSGMYGSALGGYANIQSHLRSGKPKFGKYTPEEVKLVGAVADHVSSAIGKHPLDKPMMVYRGLKINKDDPGSEHYEQLKVGDTFSDKGFTSTSNSKKIADKFTEKLNRSDKPILMEISLKAGDHALPMNEYHKSSENEVLLDRNVKFKVVSVSESKGIRKIKVELA